MKTILVLAVTAFCVAGCRNKENMGAAPNETQAQNSTEAMTPNKKFSTTNSIQGTSVPREDGNLDRGATRDNDPVNNAPGPKGTGLNQTGPGSGTATK